MTDRVLLVEDDAAMRASLTQSLELEDISVIQADSLAQARRAIRANFPGVVLSDIRMPVHDGFDVLARVQEVDRDLPVIFLTGEADVPMAVRALQSGVYDFLEKPCSVDDLVRVLRRALDHRRIVLRARRLSSTIEHSDAAAVHFPGSTSASVQLRRELRHLAELEVNVHVYGAPGTGRRLAAHTIDFLSGNVDRALALNLAQEGHRTSAPDTSIAGRTIILKNIEAAPEKAFESLMEAIESSTPARLITTCNVARADLAVHVNERLFAGEWAEVRVPDLRDRHADLPVIFENLLRQSARNLDTDTPDIPQSILDEISGREWAGNLPELRARARDLILNAPRANDAETPGLVEQLQAFEKSLLMSALEQFSGSATRAAEYLGVPRKTFYDKLARHGIEPRAIRAAKPE